MFDSLEQANIAQQPENRSPNLIEEAWQWAKEKTGVSIPLGLAAVAVIAAPRAGVVGRELAEEVVANVDRFDPKEGMSIVLDSGRKMPPISLPTDISNSERRIIVDYIHTGKRLGLSLSMLHLGAKPSVSLMDAFADAEKAYANLGYKPLRPINFANLAGYNKRLPAKETIGMLRAPGEEPELWSGKLREAIEYMNSHKP